MEKNTILLKLICPAIIVLLLNMPSYNSANYQSLSWFKIKSWFKIIDTFVLFSKDACLPCRHKRGVLGGFFHSREEHLTRLHTERQENLGDSTPGRKCM